MVFRRPRLGWVNRGIRTSVCLVGRRSRRDTVRERKKGFAHETAVGPWLLFYNSIRPLLLPLPVFESRPALLLPPRFHKTSVAWPLRAACLVGSEAHVGLRYEEFVAGLAWLDGAVWSFGR